MTTSFQKLREAVFTVLEGCTLNHDVRKILEAAYYAPEALALPTAAPVSSFEDQRVQAVYELLVDDMAPPPEEHWEGFVARRIVDKLFNPVSPASDRADFEKWAREQFYSGLACPSDTWSDDRKTYNDPAHHMAFCAFQAAGALNDKGIDAEILAGIYANRPDLEKIAIDSYERKDDVES